jgi:hypothetical protein
VDDFGGGGDAGGGCTEEFEEFEEFEGFEGSLGFSGVLLRATGGAAA